MTLQGHVHNGSIVLDQPVALPEGAQVRVELLSRDTTAAAEFDKTPSLAEKLLRYAGKAKGLPRDLARNHDHYIHGTPRE